MLTSRRWILIASAIVVAAGAGIAFAAVTNTSPPTPPPTPSARTGLVYSNPGRAALEALPDANYDAVIPGLLDASAAADLPVPVETFTLKADLTPLYGADRSGAPVATLPFLNFLGSRTVVVPLLGDGEWTEILTPSRRELPSASGSARAASQTMAWVRTDQLVVSARLTAFVLVSLSKNTLSIVDTRDGVVSASYSVGVGKADTASPVGLTYLQARYGDPGQVEGHDIYLTGAHSSVADHPFGPDQGLVGIHWNAVHSGAVSHACIRLDAAGDTAMSRLPLGTPVLVVG